MSDNNLKLIPDISIDLLSKPVEMCSWFWLPVKVGGKRGNVAGASVKNEGVKVDWAAP